MAYDFSGFKKRAQESAEWLTKEYSGIRASRATPSLLDGVQVESYGSRMPISQVGNVAVLDARTLRITPWDISQSKEIEKAITNSGMGVSVSADSQGVLVSFPELTSERREQLAKVVRDRLEQARIAIRGERDEIWSEIQKKEKAGDLSEDEKFKAKDDMQKIVDEMNAKLDDIADRKQKEIAG